MKNEKFKLAVVATGSSSPPKCIEDQVFYQQQLQLHETFIKSSMPGCWQHSISNLGRAGQQHSKWGEKCRHLSLFNVHEYVSRIRFSSFIDGAAAVALTDHHRAAHIH